MKTRTIILILGMVICSIFICSEIMDFGWCEEESGIGYKNPKIDCDNGGGVYKAWESETTDNVSAIYFNSSYDAGKNWTKERFIPQGFCDTGDWDMRCDEYRNIYIAHKLGDTLYLSYSVDRGQNWTRIDVLDGYTINVGAFKMFPSENGEVYFLIKPKSINLWQLERISVIGKDRYDMSITSLGFLFYEPDLVIDYKQNVYVIACGNIEEWVREFKLGKLDGNNFKLEWEDVPINGIEIKEPKIVCDVFNNLYILWEGRQSGIYIQCTENSGQTWLEEPRKITDIAPIFSDIISDLNHLNYGGNISVYAVWSAKDNGTTKYYFKEVTNVGDSIELEIGDGEIPNWNCIGTNVLGDAYSLFFKTTPHIALPLFARSDLQSVYRKVTSPKRKKQDSAIKGADIVSDFFGRVYAVYCIEDTNKNRIIFYSPADDYGDSWPIYLEGNPWDFHEDAGNVKNIAQDKIKQLYEMLNNDPSNLEKLADELIGEIDPGDIGTVGNTETIDSDPNHEDSAIYKDNIPIGIMGYEQEGDDNSDRVNTNIANMGSITTVQEQIENDISRGITGHTDFELIPVDEQNDDTALVNITPSVTGIGDNTVNTRSEGGAVFGGIPDNMVLKAVAPPPAEEDSGGALLGYGQEHINISSGIGNIITTNGERVGISVPDPVPDRNSNNGNDPIYEKVGSVNKERASNKLIR